MRTKKKSGFRKIHQNCSVCQKPKNHKQTVINSQDHIMNCGCVIANGEYVEQCVEHGGDDESTNL